MGLERELGLGLGLERALVLLAARVDALTGLRCSHQAAAAVLCALGRH